MSLRLGDIAPDFIQDSSEGPINFHQWLGDSWGVLYSHPADFTPVCTTELGYTAKLAEEFRKRNVKVLALSVDAVESHTKWIADINETQNTRVNFPIIADADRKVATLYDMIHPNASATATVRSVFIIDPSKKIRLTITYPAGSERASAATARGTRLATWTSAFGLRIPRRVRRVGASVGVRQQGGIGHQVRRRLNHIIDTRFLTGQRFTASAPGP